MGKMAKIINVVLHYALYLINLIRYQQYRLSMKKVQVHQRTILNHLIKKLRKCEHHANSLSQISCYEDFCSLPVTTYVDYKQVIERQRQEGGNILCDHLVRFQPTSGSTDSLKWIPYNRAFLRQFDRAASVWLADLTRQYPGILQGKHYWSLSWLPNEMRAQQNLDDSEILSPIKKLIMQQFFAVPKEVMLTQTIEDNLFATACFLVASEDLSLISVWSPTFLLSLMEVIIKNKEEIILTLNTAQWQEQREIPLYAPRAPKRAAVLASIKEMDRLYKLWPKLALVSCWDTAQSALYADRIRRILPFTPVQGKGLWATEAVITIPIGMDYQLSFQSHFYEFEDLDTGRIHPCWELRKGMRVTPIISSPNGFLRYRINDQLLVKNIKGECPVLTFQGRIKDSDLVGEKMSQQLALELFEKIRHACHPISLIGVHDPSQGAHPYYLLLTDGISKDPLTLSELSENFLQQNYHYKLARDLNQLDSIKVLNVDNAHALYEKISLDKGMIKGNIKIEPLIMIETDKKIYE
jgi:hypothetical protein